MRRILVLLLAAFLAESASAQVTRPWLGKNSKLVTVCASSSCDYQTIQGALDGTTASATAPVTILLMPGTYACGAINTPTWTANDSYKSLVGWSRDSSIVRALISDPCIGHALIFDPNGGDILGVTISNLTLNTEDEAIGSPTISADNRMEITIDNVRVTSTNTGFELQGYSGTAPTKPPSLYRIINSEITARVSAIQVFDHASGISIGNRIYASEGCFAVTGTAFAGTSLNSFGDSCFLAFNASSAAAISFGGGTDTSSFTGLRIDSRPASGYSSASTVNVVDVQAGIGYDRYHTITLSDAQIDHQAVSGQTSNGIRHQGGSDIVVLRNVRIRRGFGGGTETDIVATSPLTPWGEILLDGVTYDSANVDPSFLFRSLRPRVLSRVLRATDSSAAPATAAPLDVNGEYRLFDPTADENTSWRNERVSSLFEAQSLYTSKFRVYWTPVTATSGSVVWAVGACASAEDEPFPCTVSLTASVTDTVTGGAAGDLYVTDWTDLPTGVLSAGKAMAVQAIRDADNGSDTMAGDAALVSVEIAYGVR